MFLILLHASLAPIFLNDEIILITCGKTMLTLSTSMQKMNEKTKLYINRLKIMAV